MPEFLTPNRHFRDSLTGLFDWRKLELDLRAALQVSRHIAYVLADLDEFKRVNDKYGHDVGDRVLHDVARALAGKCEDDRSCLGPYRQGESFIVVLSDVDAEPAVKFANALRAVIEQVRIDGYSDLKITARLAVVTAAVQGGDSSEIELCQGYLATEAHKAVYCHPDDKRRNEVVHVPQQN